MKCNFTLEGSSLEAGDWTVVVSYFVFCIAIGLYASWKTNRKGTTSEYFLAGESLAWWAVGASLFASNIGSEHFIGLAGQAASYGISVAAYEWQAIWIVIILGWFFMPVYKQCRVSTMPQYLECRYRNPHLRSYLTCLALLIYVSTKISVDLYAGDVFLEEAFGLNIYVATSILLIITGLYTLFGGLSAVVYTEVLQTVIMVGGAVTLSIMGFIKVGGYSGLQEKYPKALANYSNYAPNATSGYVLKDAFSIVRSADVKTPDLPWPGIFFALPITSIYYWCSDQVTVQRVLGSRDKNHAKAGTLMTGYLKILPMFIMVLPGMISRTLYGDIIGREGCSNLAYPTLVLKLAPQGLTGLMLAVMMAALMSSLASTFNSSSTLFTLDVWVRYRRRFGRNPTQKEQLVVGRVVIIVMVCISVVWVKVVDNFQSGLLFNYIQTISSYLQPPVTAVFLCGMLWKRATDKGAFAGLLIGLFVGMTRLLLDFVFPFPQGQEEDSRPAPLQIHYLYFTLILFSVSLLAVVVVSLFTKPCNEEQLAGTTWWTRKEQYQELQHHEHHEDEEPDDKTEFEMKPMDRQDSEQESLREATMGDETPATTDDSVALLPDAEEEQTENSGDSNMESGQEHRSLWHGIGASVWRHARGWLFGRTGEYDLAEADLEVQEEPPQEWKTWVNWLIRGLAVILVVIIAALWVVFK